MLLSYLMAFTGVGFIGFCIGVTGLGGFLMPPLLVQTINIGIREAITLTLATLCLAAILGTYLYSKNHTLDYRTGIYLSCGSIPGAFLGYKLNISLPINTVIIVLGTFLIIVGLMTIFRKKLQQERPVAAKLTSWQLTTLFIVVGFGGGVAAGLTGVGGPVFVIPVLVAAGIPVTQSVGAGLFNMIIASFFAFISYISTIHIAIIDLTFVSVAELIGVALGVAFVKRISQDRVAQFLGVLSMTAGIWFFIRL